MRKANLLIGLLFLSTSLWGQDPWKITVSDVRTDNYFGVTVGNGSLASCRRQNRYAQIT